MAMRLAPIPQTGISGLDAVKPRLCRHGRDLAHLALAAVAGGLSGCATIASPPLFRYQGPIDFLRSRPASRDWRLLSKERQHMAFFFCANFFANNKIEAIVAFCPEITRF